MSRAFLTLPLLAGCFEMETPLDVMGNFAVTYADNARVYIGDELVADVQPGTEETIEWNGESFTVSQVCGEEDTACPSESGWRELAVDQPWGPDHQLLNFVNLDLERGEPGQRMGGLLEEDGSFEMLSGLAIAGDNGCAALAVGTVTGTFSADATRVEDAMLVYEWAAGCQIGEVTVGTTLRIESDCTAVRTGEYDVSSVTPEEPIDEEGDPIDPEAPETAATPTP